MAQKLCKQFSFLILWQGRVIYVLERRRRNCCHKVDKGDLFKYMSALIKISNHLALILPCTCQFKMSQRVLSDCFIDSSHGFTGTSGSLRMIICFSRFTGLFCSRPLVTENSLNLHFLTRTSRSSVPLCLFRSSVESGL